MIVIRRLIWDEWNVRHIARHNLLPEDIEAVCHGDPVILRGQQKNRLVLLGPTGEELIVAVILESNSKGIYYPVTAYPADPRDIALYRRLKGGGNREDENKTEK